MIHNTFYSSITTAMAARSQLESGESASVQETKRSTKLAQWKELFIKQKLEENWCVPNAIAGVPGEKP